MKINKSIVALLVAGYAVVPFALGANNYVMSMIVAALVIGGVALSWALLGNLGGMVSFGHSAFFGVGAYVSAITTVKLGVPVLLALPLGGIGAVLASIVMMPVLRLRGPYFALAILAYAHIFRILATEWSSVTGGSGGVSGIPGFPSLFGFDFGTKTGAYLIALTLVVLFALVYARIRASYYGIALRAMHDSEDATRVVGVNSTLLKGAMLMLSAFMAGVFGAVNAVGDPADRRCDFRRLPHHLRPGDRRAGGVPGRPAAVQADHADRAPAGAWGVAGGDDRVQPHGPDVAAEETGGEACLNSKTCRCASAALPPSTT
jgi:branched-chain amino acid transport system permease protein